MKKQLAGLNHYKINANKLFIIKEIYGFIMI